MPDSYSPPSDVRSAAKRALELREKQAPSNRAMTAVGLARARDLANGRPVSLETMRRMKAFFDRHQGTKPTSQPVEGSKWQQAWLGWGGDAGYAWAKRILKEQE
jgi:hypothetical protein